MRFQKAKPVWLKNREQHQSQFAAFHVLLTAEKPIEVTASIAARSYYRMYLNGDMVAHGPARAAEGCCRVDEIPIKLAGQCHIAIEIAAYQSPDRYCNDCTLEKGLLVAEISTSDGTVLTATGDNLWSCEELKYRRPNVEMMSHCRGIFEYYDLQAGWDEWKVRKLAQKPEAVSEQVKWLPRRAPYPTYLPISARRLRGVYDVLPGELSKQNSSLLLSAFINPKWYASVPDENRILQGILCERDAAFSGKKRQIGSNLVLTPGISCGAAAWEMESAEVGFLDFNIRVTQCCVLDVLNSDHLSDDGALEGNSYVTRYCLQPGSYQLTGFEPKLVRYIKMIFRTGGEVEISGLRLLQYTYPEDDRLFFACSDGDLNRIYEAARRTLRLNMLDILMDCPERERAGWLCDSYFSGQAARVVFGNSLVELDHMENFLLTDPDQCWNGFFPEVYPGIRRDSTDIGIRNWSFWLILELCAYCAQTGDKKLAMTYRNRVERFVEGMLSLRGESGLLENLGTVFVDWSLSNKPFAMEPISVPVNALAVTMLKQAAELYGRDSWKNAADEMEQIIHNMGQSIFLGAGGDSAELAPDGKKLNRGGCRTESGIALELWSGFHKDDREFIRRFVKNMGTSPQERPNPNIGRSNLFIGLMIRFDVLSAMGETDTLIRELKDVYLPQLALGSDTLFEAIHEKFGCHGFNGYAAALLVRDILGVKQVDAAEKKVYICPWPGKLRWAEGNFDVDGTTAMLHWSADTDARQMNLTLWLPEGWQAVYPVADRLPGWKIIVNSQEVKM